MLKYLHNTWKVIALLPLLVWQLNSHAIAQETVTGTVTDGTSGDLLPGVNVVVKGTMTGTSTNSEGEYELAVSSLQDTLVFSFIGYQTTEVAINGRTTVDVALQTQTVAGDELVVVGYGVQQKKNLTGSVQTVSSDDIANQSATTAGQLLQGRVSGVQIIQGTSQPGKDAPTINVRGVNTIRTSVSGQTEDTKPLVIVDGVESTMQDISPQDIESMTVLKDASASAIYGARAANGVILIETKSGSAGDIQASYSGYMGWQSPIKVPLVLNPLQYAQLQNEAATNVGRDIIFDQADLDWFAGFQEERFSDHTYIEGAPIQNHHLSISGGAENIQYRTSFGVQDQEGIIWNTASQRYNIRTKIDVDISDKLRGGVNVNASLTDAVQPSEEGRNTMTVAIRNQIRHPPYALVDGARLEGGTFSRGTVGFGLGPSNTLADFVEPGENSTKTYRATPKVYFEYEPVQNLIFRTSASAFIENSERKMLVSPYQVVARDPGAEPVTFDVGGDGRLVETNNESTTLLFEATANYTQSFGDHQISALAGFTDQQFDSDFFSASIRGIPPGRILKELDVGSISPSVGGSGSAWALRSGFGRLSYNFDSRYLAEVNIRYDGSSRFGEENRWGLFPSFSAGWRIDQEQFMDNVDWLSQLKLRGSWGKLGNQNIGNYRHIPTVNLGQQYVLGGSVVPGAAVTTLANPRIKWETTATTNLGIDASILDDKFTFEVDLYRRITDDILLFPPVPRTLGNLAPPAQNQGKVRNQGIELMATYFGNISTDFNFSISANFSTNDNEVLELNEEFISANKIITRVGDPISSYYGHTILGIFDSDEEAQNVEKWGVQPGGPSHAAGDYIYRDTDGDGVITGNDKTIIGDTNIRNTLGSTITVNYKGFDFRAMFQGVIGRDVEDGVFANDGMRGGNNLLVKWLDRWTPENTDTDVPRVAKGVNYNTSLFVGPPLSARILDASYVRLKHLEVGYSLPQEIVGKVGLRGFRLYFSGQNILTFTNFKDGFDPEEPLDFNNTNDSYPRAKTYSIGVNVDF